MSATKSDDKSAAADEHKAPSKVRSTGVHAKKDEWWLQSDAKLTTVHTIVLYGCIGVHVVAGSMLTCFLNDTTP